MNRIAERTRESRNSGYTSQAHAIICRKFERAVHLTSGWNDIMKKKRKPDFLFVLAIIVGIGVIITMRAQAGAEAQLAKSAASGNVAVVQATLKKTN